MKITAVHTYIVPPRWLFLKIETDAGISGWGETGVAGHERALAQKLDEFGEFIIGSDPASIEDTWQKLFRNGCFRGGPIFMSAMSAIDIALWDIKGKSLGVAIHQLLGGPVRSKIRTYRWIGGDRPTNLVVDARALLAEGFDACKFNICSELQIVDTYRSVDKIIDQLSDLRSAVGSDMDLAFDFHGRVHAPMAKILLKELEHLRPIFVEDAVQFFQVGTMSDLSQSTSIPLVIGERMHSRFEFKQYFEQRAVSIINPDVCTVGGISEILRIGNWAEAYDIALAPHCPIGPIGLAASLQIDAICHNAFIQEQSLGIHYNATGDMLDYVLPGKGFEFDSGFLKIPDRPGLGIEMDEEAIAERSVKDHGWKAPVWRHADGSIADW